MQHRVRQLVIILTTAISLFYLAYRGLYTLNFTTYSASILSVALYLAEGFGIVSVLLFFVQVWEVSEPPQQPILEGRTVDVFVPTYNEDPLLLRATLEACRRLEYPHKTYLCDDGGSEARFNDPEKHEATAKRRAALQALCDELGAHYMIRPDNRHAKAGNLNYAFTQTHGEFIIIFDADHVPEPHFITRLIGYFKDEKLGFIQTPHAFYNFENFQSRLDHANRKYWEEGQLFYSVIQPGRNKWNCPIFAGSAAMFRRKALEEVGYIAVETITEDMHTGMRMNSRGWKSLGIAERMVAGQAAPDITTFHVQRLRWGEGNLSIMAYDNPMVMKGLKFMQRLCYLGSMIHWAGGLFKLAIYLTPVIMLFTGVSPVSEFTWFLFGLTIVYLVASVWGVQYASNGFGSVVYGELFCMVNFWTQVRGLMRAIFWRKFQSFVVTSKRGRQSNSVWPFIRPQVILVGLCVASIIWGWGRLAFGVSDDYFKPILPTFWNCFHILLGVMAVRRALWPEDKRYSYRHVVNVPATFTLYHNDGGKTHHTGVTVDLNEGGVGLVAFKPMPVGSAIRLTIEAGREKVECTGQVRWAKEIGDTDLKKTFGWRFGVKFDELAPQTLDAVNRLALHYGVSRLFHEYEQGNRNSLLMEIRKDISNLVHRKRYEHRRPYRLPVHVYRPGRATSLLFVTEDIHSTSFAALTEEVFSVADKIEFRVESPFDPIIGTAKVVRKERRRYGARHCWLVAFEYTHLEGDSATIVHDLVGPAPTEELKTVVAPDRKPLKLPYKKQLAVGLAACMLLGASQLSVFPFVYKDELFLRQLATREENPTEAQLARFDNILSTTMNSSYPSTDRLVLLMACLPKVNRLDDTGNLMKFLAPRDRSNLDLQLALAQAFDSGRDYSQAEAEYQRLLGEAERTVLTASKRREFLVAAARASVHSQDMDRAVERFRAALKEFPGDDKLRNEFVGVLIAAGRFKEVPAIYEGREPDDEGRMLLMSAYAMANDFEAAERESRIIVAKRPDDPQAKALLADMLSYRKNFLQSRAIYERLAKDAPGDPALRVKMASIALWSRNYGEALEQFAALWKNGNKKREVVHGYIDAAAGVQELGEQHRPSIEAIFEHLVSEPKPAPIYLARLGWVFERYKDFAKSMQLLERAATLAPNDPEIRKQYFAVLVINGRSNEAMELLGADRDDPEVRKLLIDVHIRKSDFAAAEKECRAVLLGKTDDVQTLRSLADLLSWKGQHRESLEVFEKLKTLKPDDASVPIRIAEVTLWSKNFDRALELFQAQLETKFDQPSLWRDYIDAAAAAKTLPAAVPEYAVRIAKEPALIDVRDPAFLARLAWVLTRCREPEFVSPLLDRALALRPTQPEIKKALVGGLSSAGRGKEALLLYETLPPADRDRVQLIHIHCSMKNWPAAEQESRSLLAEKPNDLEIERLLADVISWKGAHGEALDLLAKLRESLPKDESIPVRIAEVTLWSGHPDKAMDQFVKLIDASPKRTELWSGFADAASALKTLDRDRLVSALKVAAAIVEKPVNAAPTTMSRLAWSLMRASKKVEASKLLDLLAAKPPKDALSRREIGGVFAAAGRSADAVKMFEGLEVTAEDHLQLASLHAAQKNFPAALKECQEALAKDPNHRPTKRRYAEILTWTGKHKEALEVFAELRKTMPLGEELLTDERLTIARIHAALKDFAAAEAECRAVLAAKPNHGEAERLLADVLSWKGDLPAATAILEKLQKAAPNDRTLAVRMAEVALWSGDSKTAVERFTKLMEEDVNHPEWWPGFADAAAAAPNLPPKSLELAARIAALAATESTMQDAARLSRLSWALIRGGRAAAAQPLLTRAVQLNPTEAETRRELAGVLAAAQRTDDALQFYKGLSLDPQTRSQLAWLHCQKKDFAAAADECREALLLKPDDPKIKRQLADILSWHGKHREAIALFEQIMNGPHANGTEAVRIAEISLWSGDADDALRRLAALLEADFNRPALWRSFADAAAGAKALTASQLKLVERIAAQSAVHVSDDAAFLSRLAWSLIREKRVQFTATLLDRAAALPIKDPKTLKEVAGVLSSANRGKQALKLLSTLPPEDVDQLQLAMIHASLADWPAAERACRAAMSQRPGDPVAERALADVLSWKGDHAKSLEIFGRLLTAYPEDPTIPRRIAEVTLWSGDSRTAAGLIADWLDKHPTDADAIPTFVDAVAAVDAVGPREKKHAVRISTAVLKNEAEERPSVFYGRLAWTLLRTDEKALAGKLLDKITATPPSDPSIRKELAGVLAAADRVSDALKFYRGLTLTPDDHLRLANWHAMRKDFEAAEKEVRIALASRPGDPKITRTLADVLSWKGDYRAALDILKPLHEAAPNDRELLRRLAEISLWKGDGETSLGWFEKLLDLDFAQSAAWPGFLHAAATAEALSESQGKLALKLFEQTELFESKDTAVLSSMAWMLHKLGRDKQAEKVIEQALKLPLATPDARKRLAGILEVLGRPADAVKLYEGLTLSPDDHLRLAGLHAAQRDFASAKKSCEAALADQPNNPKAKRLLADVLSWKGEYPQALAAFAKLRRDNPADPELPIRVAETTLWARQYDRAMDLFAELIEANPKNAALRAGFVDAAASASKYLPQHQAIAVKLADAVVKDENASATYCSRLAWALHQMDDKIRVHRLLDLAISKAPQEPSVRRELAGMLTVVRRTREAAALFDGQELDLEDRLKLAGIHSAANEFHKAEEQLRDAVETDPNDPRTLTLLGDVLTWQRKHSDAEKIYLKLLAKTPNDRDVQLKFAQAALWSGQYDAALERIGAMLRRDPQSANLWPLFIDAAASAKLFDPQTHKATAAMVAERVLADPNKSSISLPRLGWVLRRAGDLDASAAVLRRAVALNPEIESIRLKYAETLSQAGKFAEAREQYDVLLRGKKE